MGEAAGGALGDEAVANYILLMTLTPEGREKVLADPERVLRAGHETNVDGVQGLGLYGVLGPYDFVGIIEAPDNDAAARYSMQLGVKAMVHITTLPAVPVALLQERSGGGDALATGAEASPGDRGDPVA